MSPDTPSNEPSDFFALPAFKAQEALVRLRRDLRELKLTERSGGDAHRYEWKGLAVAELVLAPAEPAAIVCGLVKRPAQRPEWARQSLTSSAEVRRWLEGVKRQLQAWTDDD
jgi:hypothetical protein